MLKISLKRSVDACGIIKHRSLNTGDARGLKIDLKKKGMMSKRQLEGEIKTAICYYLMTRRDIIRLFWINSSVGIYDPVRKTYRKNNSKFQINGVSDILGILNDGRFLAVECKSEKGTLSIEQKIFLEEIRAAGGIAFMARSVEDVQNKFKEIKLQ